MIEYLKLLSNVLENGVKKTDRTGTGTLSIFGQRLCLDLSESLPIVTTKKIHLPSVIEELLWFLRGESNVKSLQAKGITIWDEWADKNGDLGPVYGKQWRRWGNTDGYGKKIEIDQISDLIKGIENEPNSRRHIVSAWNVGEIIEMALAPCHVLFQFYVNGKKLSCQVYQRSADVFLGVPFNIASYSILTNMVAHQTGLQPEKLIWIAGDCHLYHNHLEQAVLQLTRKPFDSPKIRFQRKPKDIFSYEYYDFKIECYKYHPPIKAPISI